MNCELILEVYCTENNVISGCGPMGQVVCCGTIQRLYKDNWSGKCRISFIMVSFRLETASELYPTLRTSKGANFQVDHQLVGRLTFLL